MPVSSPRSLLRFGLFELDAQAGQLCKNGTRIRLPQQPLQVLFVLLERPGNVVTREELRQRLWPQDVFVDFDHGLNKSVQKLRDALGDSANSPRYIETIPRVGYRFLAPVSEVTAQAGQNAPAATVPTANGAGTLTAAPMPVTRKAAWFRLAAMWWLAGAVVCAALLAVGARIEQSRQSRVTGIHSIAVIPLDNLSGDPDQNYFADGMTDELTTMLAKDSTLRVVSRTSAMQYKGVHKPLPEIARELGVDGIVEGSVEKNGDSVHMTLQLIQGPSDTHVWANSYDRQGDDLVTLPADAAREIAEKTNSAVVERPRARYVNPAAHDAYLRGQYLWFRGINEEAGKYFKQAIALQPDYALAWAGLSAYYGQAGDEEMESIPANAEALAAAQKAVALDATLPQARLALCAAIFVAKWDWVRADQQCVRAIELDPKFAEAYHFRAKILSSLNRHDEAIAFQKKATELDPFERPWAMGEFFVRARRYDEAIEDAREHLVTNPRDPDMYFIMANAYRGKGMLAQAAQDWAKGTELSGDPTAAATIRRDFAEGGYAKVLRWNISVLEKMQREGHYVSPVNMALQYAQLGDREKTLSFLEDGLLRREDTVLDIQDESAYDFLHADPRYRAIIKSIGLPPAY